MSGEDLRNRIRAIRELTTARMLSTAVSTLQRETKGDREAKGPSWVSRVTLPAPAENDACQMVVDAIERLGTGNEQYTLHALDDTQWHRISSYCQWLYYVNIRAVASEKFLVSKLWSF